MSLDRDATNSSQVFRLALADLQGVLSKYGVHNIWGAGDYAIRTDDMGNWEHSVRIDNHALLQTALISDIYDLISTSWRRFSVVLTVDDVHNDTFPTMRVDVTARGIIDRLDRAVLGDDYLRLPFDDLPRDGPVGGI
ncbi:MAG: hypothetical protein R3D27_02330 [Hyphomicrobiaceae bacterium]